jgi:hypothetical protein
LGGVSRGAVAPQARLYVPQARLYVGPPQSYFASGVLFAPLTPGL